MLQIKEVEKIARLFFGLVGKITPLPGEYDLNFRMQVGDGREFILKLSKPEPELLLTKMQNEVLQFLDEVPKSFQTPQLLMNLAGEKISSVNFSTGDERLVRLFNYLPGKLLAEIADHSPLLIHQLGSKIGELSNLLFQFKHPAAKRYFKWDLKEALWIRNHLNIIAEQNRQPILFFLDFFEQQVLPELSNVRQSIIHGDLNDYNILVENHEIFGFIDFGDLVESAIICELAIAASYAMLNKPDPLATLFALVKGYHAVFPLTEQEIAQLFPLIGMRLCVSVVNSALRKTENSRDEYLTISEKPAWQLLEILQTVDSRLIMRTLVETCRLFPSEDIQKKRSKYIGKSLSLAYHEPLHIVRGSAQYLFDDQGRQYLDCVNNVCHVGHCHPEVVAAGQQQMAVLNTNTRYLHANLVHYAERLIATLPKPLEVCFFVSSGSEANELALRLAETHTKREHFAVLDHSYFGNTSRLINLSPYKFNGPGGKGKPDFVQVIPLPDLLRNKKPPTLPVLKDNLVLNDNLAAFISESFPSCGGQVVLPENYLAQIYALVRKAGGLCIADEIQVGLGRIGTHFWGFESQQVIPDIVTMGKPLGNGHPIGAVVTTREIAESFANGMEYFNTFGGNPVSCDIGLSVLEVIAKECLQSNAEKIGAYLQQKLVALQIKHHTMGDVRGRGLFLGIEMVSDKESLSPAKTLAVDVVNRMKQQGILLSTDGRYGNVIKIKPPLIFTRENADFLVTHLDAVFTALRQT